MSDAASAAGAVVWPGLTSVIAYAFLSIATMNLTNSLGSSLYSKESAKDGDLEFTYDSNDAQRLRLALANYPRRLWPAYVLFVILEVAYAAWMLLGGTSNDGGGSSDRVWGWYGGIPLLAVVFTAFLVGWTARLNSRYYSVMDETRSEDNQDA